VEQFGSSLGS